jgi:hypothetical protein
MTPREFFMLKRVWAMKEASFHNAHFRSDDVPFTADDFMDSHSRVERKAKALRDKADVLMERQRMDMMKPESGDGVPLMFREIGKVN